MDSAPCQEVVRTGDDVKLSDLPIPIWTPGKDIGPYITCDVGVVNDLSVILCSYFLKSFYDAC